MPITRRLPIDPDQLPERTGIFTDIEDFPLPAEIVISYAEFLHDRQQGLDVSLEADLTKASSDLAARDATIERLGYDLKINSVELYRSQGYVGVRDSEIARLREEVGHHEAVRDPDAHATIERLKADTATLTATYNALAEEREELKAELAGYGSDCVDKLQQTIDERNVEIAALQSALHNVKGLNAANAETYQSSVEGMQASIATLQNDVTDLEAVAKRDAEDKAVYRKDYSELEEALSTKSNELDISNALGAETERANAKLCHDAFAAQDTITAQREQLAENITELNTYKAELKKHRDEIVRCTQNNIDLQDQYSGKTDELREEKTVLVRALADAMKRAGPEKMAAGREADSAAPVDKGSPEKPQVGDVWKDIAGLALRVLRPSALNEGLSHFMCSHAAHVSGLEIHKKDEGYFHKLISRNECNEKPFDLDSDIFTVTFTPEEVAARDAKAASLAKKRRSFIERWMLARAAMGGDNYELSFKLAVEAWAHIQASIGGAS